MTTKVVSMTMLAMMHLIVEMTMKVVPMPMIEFFYLLFPCWGLRRELHLPYNHMVMMIILMVGVPQCAVSQCALYRSNNSTTMMLMSMSMTEVVLMPMIIPKVLLLSSTVEVVHC